jgi:hypothetical protein
MSAADIATLGIRVDARQVRDGDQALQGLAQSGAQAEQSVDRLAGTLGRLERLAKQAAAAFAAFKLAKLVEESALLNARFETMGVVMNVAGKNAGYSAAMMASLEQQMQKTGISAIKSRETLTAMATANIDLAKATQLARVAQDLAVVGNINSSEATARLVHGIQSGEIEILRTLGLNVNFEASYKKLAIQLGTTSDKLTGYQKMQARTNVVLQEGAKFAGIYEQAMGTAGKQILSMQRYVEDLRTKAGEVFNETLTIAVMAWTEHLKDSNKEVSELAKNGQLAEWGRDLAGVFVGVANAIDNILTGAKMAGTWAAHQMAGAKINSEFDRRLATAPKKATLAGAAEQAEMIERERQAAFAKEQQDYEAAQVALAGTVDRFQRAFDERQMAKIKKQQDDAAKQLKIDQDYAARSQALLIANADKSVEIQQAAQTKLAQEVYGGGRTAAQIAEEVETKRLAALEAAQKQQKKYDETYKDAIKSIQERTAALALDDATQGKLTEGQKYAIKVLDDLRTGELKLSDAKKRTLTADLEAYLAQERITQANDAARKAEEEALKAANAPAEKIWEQVRALQAELETWGLVGQAAIRAQMAKVEVQLQSAELSAAETAALESQLVALRELEKLQGRKDWLEAIDQARKDTVAEAQKAADQMAQAITDSIMRGFEGGKGFAANFFHSIVNAAATMVLRPIVQAVSQPLAQTATGVITSVGQSAGLLSGGSSLANGVGLASTITSAFNSSVVGQFFSGLSGSASAASAALGGAELTGAASAGAAVSSAIAAIPGWGWAALGAAAVASLFGGGKESDTRLTFGSNNAAGNVNINDHGNEGNNIPYLSEHSNSAFGSFGITGGFWMDTKSKQISDFVATVGKVDDALAALLTGTEKANVTAALTAQSTTVHTGAEGSDPNANGQLDSVFAQRIRAILDAISPDLGKLIDGFKGTSQELATEAEALLKYRNALKDAGEAVFGVKVTLEQVAALAQSGETASAALTRVTSVFEATNAAAQALGQNAATAFGALGLGSYDTRAALALAAGGVDVLNQQVASFAQNFTTDAQRLDTLNAALAKLGYTNVTTKEQFYDIAHGLDLTTAAGRDTFVALMAIQGAFAQLHPDDTAKQLEIANKQRELEVAALRAAGNEAGAVAAERQAELAALDESLRPLQERVYALQDEAAKHKLGIALLRAQGNETAAVAAERADELAAMDASLRPMQARIWLLQDESAAIDAAYSALERSVAAEKKLKETAYKAASDAIAKQIDTVKTRLSDLQALSSTLHGALDQLHPGGQDANTRRAAQAQLDTMLAIVKAGGALPKADDVQRVLSTLTADSTDQFASFRDYQRDQYLTAIKLTDLSEATDTQIDNTQAQLDALNALKDATDAAYQADIDRLDGILETAKAQIDALKGIDVSVLSVVDAVNNLGSLIAASQSANAGTAQIVGAYQSALGRAPDAAGLAFWQQQAANGVPMSSIIGAIGSSAEAQGKIDGLYEKLFGRHADAAGADFWTKQLAGGTSLSSIEAAFRQSDEYKAKVPGFAAGGAHAGGWRVVGEKDWELEYTAPSRIVSNSDARSMLDNSQVVAALDGLRKELVPVLRLINTNTNRTAKSNDEMNRREQEAEDA